MFSHKQIKVSDKIVISTFSNKELMNIKASFSQNLQVSKYYKGFTDKNLLTNYTFDKNMVFVSVCKMN